MPTARFSLAGSSLLPGRRARRARFPTCGVIRVAGIHFSRFSEGRFESPHYPSRKNGQVNNRFSKIFEIFFLTAFFEAFSRDVPSDKRLRGDIRQAALRTLAAATPQIVRSIRAQFPDVPILATGGPNDETILETIHAGANAITYSPPSNGELFADIMQKYRGKL